MDTETFRVRSGEIDLHATDPRRTSAQVSADGRTLFVATSGAGSSVTAIDVRTLEVLDSWNVGGDVTGLGLSADGSRLYAATADGLEILDVTDGSEVAAVAVHTPEPVTKVIALAS
jgi:DNA-binding beta-propeller fold protein YncE